MKPNIQIVITLIFIGFFDSCKTTRFGHEDYAYKEEIRDSMLVSTLTSIEGKFIYGEFDSIQFKGTKEDYDREIESMISSLSEGLYKDTYQEMRKIISIEFSKSDSINLNTLKTTNLIKNTNLIMYPIPGIVKSGKLFVYDKRMEALQDSIWEKSYYRERLFQDSISAGFYEGKFYTTKAGKEFLRVELKSGH